MGHAPGDKVTWQIEDRVAEAFGGGINGEDAGRLGSVGAVLPSRFNRNHVRRDLSCISPKWV
jgi:hypothetical protein